MPSAARRLSGLYDEKPPHIFTEMGQDEALLFMRDQIDEGSLNPTVCALARVITKDVPARDDWKELQAIYAAVKTGRADLKSFGLQKGFRYVADARAADQYSSAEKILRLLAQGANGGDCDDATILVGSLVASIGFRAGARGYGPKDMHGEFVHVYPCALIPKDGPWKLDAKGRPDESHVVGLDTTVSEAKVGWQPPPGEIATAWTE